MKLHKKLKQSFSIVGPGNFVNDMMVYTDNPIYKYAVK